MPKTDQSEQLCLKVEEAGVALTSIGLPQITSENQTALQGIFENHLYAGKTTGLEIPSLALSNIDLRQSIWFH